MASSEDMDRSGEELVQANVITAEDLAEARKRAQASGTPWFRQLLHMQKISFDVMNDFLHYEFHSQKRRKKHQALGAALIETGVLREEQLADALAVQKRNGKLLGEILLDTGGVTRDDIARVLSRQYGLAYTPLAETPSEKAALDAVPENVARQKEFIPIRLDGDKLTVLICGPQAPARLKDVGVMLGLRIQPCMTAADDIKKEIARRYSVTPLAVSRRPKVPTPSAESRQPAADESFDATGPEPAQADAKRDPGGRETDMATVQSKDTMRFDEIAREAQGAPVTQLVTTIIQGAVNSGATDIHLDPQTPEMRVRYRIDGVLHDVMSIPREIENAVVSRMKILADVDITETRRPQDGHASMHVREREFDIRVATMPTFLGERIVLRLLDQSAVLAGIRDLGLEPEDERKLTTLIDQPYGMILVTGPTGSGKTTTLYSCLNQKDVMSESIVTLEDPIEYQLSGINQVQIDTDIDMGFANVLRSALRQDIDVLLVGEIRDPETARIAIRAAMTGHLVFSTLHTNDAPEAIATLRNMDIPSYLIASALTGVIAQRLVRKICEACKTHYKPSKSLLKSLGLPERTARLYRGKGCDHCYQTGSHGRTGIFEVLEITPEIRQLIVADEPVEKITKAAKLKTMAYRCRQKARDGTVTAEEFLRVIRT